MRLSTWTATMAVLGLGAGLASEVEAQDPDRQRGMMGQGMMETCSMMSGQGMMGRQSMMRMMGMQRGPAALLAAADQLALSDEQVARLGALGEQSSEEYAAHMRAAMQAQREASQILAAEEPDLEAYRGALDEAADHMVLAQVTMTRASLEALEELTEDQRALLEDGMMLMGRMMCGMGGR